MQKKCFLLAFCLFMGTFLGASNASMPVEAFPAFVSCSVPAPGNFHVVEIGTTWVKLAWNNEPNAFGGYRIRIFRTSDNALIATQLRSQDELDVTMGGLQAGIAYYAIINSRCENGSNGPDGAPEDFISLIIELIVDGYTPPMPSEFLCTLTVNNPVCPLNSGGILNHFMVVLRDVGAHRFSIQHFPNGNNNPTGNDFKVGLQNDNEGATFTLKCMNLPTPGDPYCTASSILIFHNSKIIAEFTCSASGGMATTATMIINQLAEGCTIYRIDPHSSGRPGEDPVYTDPQHTQHYFSAAPNPFKDELDVLLDRVADTPVRLQLVNLHGQLVLDQEMEAGQSLYQLSTAQIPRGFYLLRVEVDGETQVLKVVKSE